MLDSPLEGARPSHVIAVDEISQQGLFFPLPHKPFEQSKARHDHTGSL